MAETNSQVPKSEPLIDSESGSFFLKHQKLLVYVEKVTEEQILKLLEYAVKNMAKRLKLDKDSVSNHPVIQPVEKTNIVAEYRFFVIDGKVVTGCQYHQNSKLFIDCLIPDGVREYAKLVASKWQPESAYVLDIAKQGKGQLGVMEINSFSCSGLYKCDQRLIIENIIELFNKEKQEMR